VVICLVLHLVGIYIFFQFVISSVQELGWVVWIPVAGIECIVLIFAIKKIEEKLTSQHEITDLG